jgi:hypothetical protein
MAVGDNTVELLREIRDEIRNVRSEVQELRVDSNGKFDGVRGEIRASRNETAERFGMMETALLDLVEHQSFVVRYTRAMAERDIQLEPRLSALESRVDKLEPK